MDFIVVSMLFMLSIIYDTDAVDAPHGLHVIVEGTSATLYWMTEAERGILRFQITYQLVNSAYGTFRLTHGVSPIRRSFSIRGLVPLETYSVYMVTVAESGTSNHSEPIEFATNLTLGTFEYIQTRSRGIRVEEALVVVIVVGLWVFAMVLFLKQWDNIRILQPMEPRFKHSPKNLDTILVVKRPQDSVIYKNYSRKMSLTMVAREKKLMRMNTVPIMENVHTLKNIRKMPTIEMEELSLVTEIGQKT